MCRPGRAWSMSLAERGCYTILCMYMCYRNICHQITSLDLCPFWTNPVFTQLSAILTLIIHDITWLYMYIPIFAVKMHEMAMDIPIFWAPLMVPHGATMAGADPLRSPLLAPGEPTTRAAANTSCGRPRRPNRAAWPGLPGATRAECLPARTMRWCTRNGHSIHSIGKLWKNP